ncbi:MAG: hypothetical protein KGJ35_00160 [Patescibacteria group bacterium]|nr:hypothetical protein [Patescibacteria group bacterium]
MNIKKIVSSVVIGAGAIIVGLGIQYVLADWTPAPSSPPNGNTAAPINVGGGTPGNIYTQSKTGLLALANLVVTNMNVASGTINAAGSVLTNDGNGNASWASAGGSGSGSIPSGAIMAFDLSTCPTGWSTYTAAYGRTIIGSGPATTATIGGRTTTVTSAYANGATGGSEKHTLSVAELPIFTVTTNLPIKIQFGSGGGGPWSDVYGDGQGGMNFTSKAVGGGQAHSIMQPYIAELYCRKD